VLTPEGSIIVSLTTPQGTTLSEQPSLRTAVSSESMATLPDLSRDLGRIAEDLHRYNEARGDETRAIADNVQALRDELRNLSEFLHRTPSPAQPVSYFPPQVPHPPPQVSHPPPQVSHPPPQVPQPIPQPVAHVEIERVNRAVGGSSIVSSLDRGGLTVSSGQLTRAPSSASSIGSFLSSHHSDDDLLASEVYPDSPPPPWPAPPIFGFDGSSAFTDSSSSSYDSGLYADELDSPSLPPLPPPSPSPSPSTSTTSTATARPLPTPPDLLGPLNAIRDQLNALWDGQTSTNHMLDELRDRRIPQPDNRELIDRLHRIEDLLQALLSQEPRERIVTEPAPPSPPSDATSDATSDSLSHLRRILGTFDSEPEMAAPIPARARGPSLVQQLDEILSSTANPPPLIVEQPPRLVPFVYQPAERGARPRSTSPVSISILPRRPDTEPPFPQFPYWPPRQRHRRRGRPAVVSDVGPTQEPPDATAGPARSVRPVEEDPDMLQAVREHRRQRRPETDGTFHPGPPPRPIFVRIECFAVSCTMC
jgi:hypothetical protein